MVDRDYVVDEQAADDSFPPPVQLVVPVVRRMLLVPAGHREGDLQSRLHRISGDVADVLQECVHSAGLSEGRRTLFQDRHEQEGFRGEVLLEARVGDACGFGDLAQRDGLESPVDDEPAGR
ncbi:hypothetical protein [Sanguibacter sp. Leaf3]|uniref:hypothetical protein n=1 Tax=Sanguibacter sp. Leaf3 TaxID=1736209 RepID=UPI001F35AE6B|nr:hypothetical protein [Sanguibacter sp. Leaf3]